MNTSQARNYNHAYGYIRWSSDGQEDGDTEGRQLDNISKMANEIGRVPVKVFYDRGVSAVSGANLKAEWQKLKETLKPGDVILVENADRITRQGLHTFLQVLHEVVVDKKAFIKLNSPNGIEINKDNYQSNFNILLGNVVATEELKKGMDRRQGGMDRMKEKLRTGKWAKVSQRPWWIESDEKKECYTVNEARANIVRDIYRMYNEGLSHRKIATIMEHHGINEGKKTQHWSASWVGRLLKDKAVLGYFRHIESNVKLYPAIISEDVYWATQEKLRVRQKYSGPELLDDINLLKSLMVCAECGSTMRKIRNVITKPDGTRIPMKTYYKCEGGHVRNTCDQQGIRRDRLEESLRMLLSKCDIITKFITTGKTPTPYKLDTLLLQLEDVRKKETKLANIITNDDTPSQVLLKSLKEVEAEGRRLSVEIEREEITLRSAEPTMSMIQDAYKNKLLEKWQDQNARLQIRELLRSIIKQVVVNKREKWYEVHFKGEVEEPIRVELRKNGYSIAGTEEIPYVTPRYSKRPTINLTEVHNLATTDLSVTHAVV